MEKELLCATLCFPVRADKILLGLKMHKIGRGCLNGYGGGIKLNENPRQAAVRELYEESGIIALPDNLEKVAILNLHNTKSDGVSFVCQVHTYLVRIFEREPIETDEMTKPTWFEFGQLPLDRLMLADREWLPIVLAGKKILVTAKYGPFQKELLGGILIQKVDSFND